MPIHSLLRILNPGGIKIEDYLFSALIGILAILVGIAFQLLVYFILRRLSKLGKISIKGVDLRLEHWKYPLLALIPAIVFDIVLSGLVFPKEIKNIIQHIVDLWIIGSLAWLSIKTVHIFQDMLLSRYQIDARDNLKARRMATGLRLIERIVTVAIILIAFAFMLMTFAKIRQIGVSLLASAGVLGIILGFAAQRTLGTIFAGIQIAITQPIRLEDVVIVENEWGWIEEITLMYVVVRIWDLRRLIVPITYFIEKPFQNWTRISADLLGSVFLYTDYTVPVQAIREELFRILDNTDLWDKKARVLQVTNATEHTIELRALMSAADSPTAWNLRCLVREQLIKFLQERYPESLPRMRVELEKDKPTEQISKEN